MVIQTYDVKKEKFLDSWAKKSVTDKRWNLLQIAWMVGALIIIIALILDTISTVLTLVGATIIVLAIKELGRERYGKK